MDLLDIVMTNWSSLCFFSKELDMIVHPFIPIAKNQAAVYVIRHPATSRYYFGSSGGVATRLRAHRKGVVAGKHTNKILQACHDMDYTLEYAYCTVENETEATQIECKLIRANLKDELMMNVMGRPLSSDQIERIRAANTGKKQGRETKERRARARAGFRHTEATKALISRLNKGRVHSPEMLRSIYSKKLLNVYSVAGRQLARERMLGNRYGLGYRHTPEMKEHLRRVNLKKVYSEETKRRISASKKKAYAANLRRGKSPPRSRPVMVNGVRYHSVSCAAKELGMLSGKLYGRVVSDNPDFKDYFFVDEEDTETEM